MDNGMIIRRDHLNESWPEEILWPVVKVFTQKGWRTGSTRFYTLKCGHQYHCPASDPAGRGKVAKCGSCGHLWQWINGRGGAIYPRYTLNGVHADILAEMQAEAERRGKLIRPIGEQDKGEPNV